MEVVFYKIKEKELVADQSWFKKLKSFLTKVQDRITC